VGCDGQESVYELAERFHGKGDFSAFEELFHLLIDVVQWRCEMLLLATDCADEAAQRTFIVLYSKLRRKLPAPPLTPYVLKIASRMAIKVRQERNRSGKGIVHSPVSIEALDLAVLETEHGPESALEQERTGAAVEGAIRNLPADYREAITLRLAEQLPYRTIGERLEISESAAKVRVFRAKRMIADFVLAAEQKSEEDDALPH
jgi:RNA polymerase sigma-70 factor (ECF subfamily)